MQDRHIIRTTDAEIDAALAQASDFARVDRRLKAARYDPKTDRVVLTLDDDVLVGLPRKKLQGLQKAPPAALKEIEIVQHGTGIRWPQLDVDHYVLGLLNGIFGTRAWLASIGRQGGSSSSRAKVAAARRNGKRGGRPRTAPASQSCRVVPQPGQL